MNKVKILPVSSVTKNRDRFNCFLNAIKVTVPSKRKDTAKRAGKWFFPGRHLPYRPVPSSIEYDSNLLLAVSLYDY